MKRLKIALLVVENNDYQAEQVIAATEAARGLEVDLEVIHTEHDAIEQSGHVLKLLYRPADNRPDAILFEPVGTPLVQAAKIAASSGVAWVVLNREVDYVKDLRRDHSTPVFCVTTSHTDVGRIQGQQIARFSPHGGAVLYIQGPSDNNASVRRTAGVHQTKPANVELRILRGLWTEQSAYQAVSSWLMLKIGKDIAFGVVAAQNDAMALGAYRAFEELANGDERERWLRLPFIGCDGLPNSGQAAVRSGRLAATIVIPPNAGQAIKAVADAVRTKQQPPECVFVDVDSFPPLASLMPRH
jgi:ribose transport system substrate-binding protein